MFKPRLIVKGTEVPGITQLIPGPEPLWGDGTGRITLDGHYSGTFVGYFTTLEIHFDKLKDAEFNLVKTLLEHPFLDDVQFEIEKDMGDYKQGDLFTEDFYNGSVIKATPLACGDAWNEFTVVLTAVDRRPQLV